MLVRNLPEFARFLPIAALYHGQIVNVSGIARDCGVVRTKVQGFLDILENTLLAFRLPAFQPRLRARERHHPKLYWVDPGLFRSVKRLHGPIAPEERDALMEGWVLHLLRAHGEAGGLFDELHYWAPHPANQTEVEFLLRRGDKLAAIEVKIQPRYHTCMLRDCERSRNSRNWRDGCSSMAASGLSGPATESTYGPLTASIRRSPGTSFDLEGATFQMPGHHDGNHLEHDRSHGA